MKPKHKFLLTDTLIREMTEEKDQILQNLENTNSFEYAIQLIEEPGEVLITRFMSEEEIEEAVSEAITELFPGKNVSEIKTADVLLEFKINN